MRDLHRRWLRHEHRGAAEALRRAQVARAAWSLDHLGEARPQDWATFVYAGLQP